MESVRSVYKTNPYHELFIIQDEVALQLLTSQPPSGDEMKLLLLAVCLCHDSGNVFSCNRFLVRFFKKIKSNRDRFDTPQCPASQQQEPPPS